MRPKGLRALSFAALLAVAASAPLVARATDFTDIWWAAGGGENGWGVNFVQNQSIVFATFYIYDINKQPTWYTSAMTVDATGAFFTGPLYQTSGSFFGVPWDPTQHPAATLVGAATFTPASSTAGSFNYNVTNIPGQGNVTVAKSIQRLAFQTIQLAGSYSGVLVETFSGCTNSANNGTGIYDIDPQITQSANQLQMYVLFTAENGFSCTLTGLPIQSGQLTSVPAASFGCSSGYNGSASAYDIKSTGVGIEGRWSATLTDGSGCQESAKFSAVLLQ